MVEMSEDRGSGLAAPCAVAGVAAVVLSMVGLIVIYATSGARGAPWWKRPRIRPGRPACSCSATSSPTSARRYACFSELLLGVWLGGTGGVLHRRRVRSGAAGWAMLGVGGCTLCVAILKILDPHDPPEDFPRLYLTGAYVIVGVRLLRSGARIWASRTPVESATTYSVDRNN